MHADGFKRDVYLINGQQPGPLIEVDEGDNVEIFVQNDLKVETTLHWHGEPLLLSTGGREAEQPLKQLYHQGLLQRGTPQMDGVPGVTQVRTVLPWHRPVCDAKHPS